MADDIDDQIDDTLSEEDKKQMNKKEQEKPAPVFKVFKDTKIPVSSKLGMVWRERKSLAMRMRQHDGTELRWEQALRYYYNDQRPMRADGTPDDSGHKRLVGSGVTEVENLVYANAHALIPAIYAKQPDIEITEVRTASSDTETTDEEAAHARVHERLTDEIMRREDAPGVNLSPKMKRASLMAHLTDRSYLQVEYVQKENSSDAALQNLQELSEKFSSAKDAKEIAEIEGQLLALEEKVAFLSPSGPTVRVRRPFDVIIDPSAELGLSDARYVMIADYPELSLINAVYNEKDENGDWKTVYKGTHIAVGEASTKKDDVDTVEYTNLVELKDQKTHNTFGFSNEEDFLSAQRILVWYVWDKTTRRVLLFADNNWEWPIWVWDDPYKLPGFYNLIPFSFNVDPEKQYSRSEVVYQLDQQDALNLCNSQNKKIRRLAADVFTYDDRIDKKVIDEVVLGAIAGPKGIPVNTNGGEIKLNEAIAPLLAPAAQVAEVFDKQPHIEAFNRLSSITNVLRGVEYKTNTTNKAIESYEGGQQMRLDEKIDTTENVIAKVGLMIMHMCVQFMSKEEVNEIVDMPEVDALWTNMTPTEFDKKHAFKVVGGSAIKPTSKAKKEEANLAVQQLGQFASVSPVSFLIALKVFEKAFDSNVITKEDWQLVRESIQAQLGGQAGPSGEGPQQGGGGEGGDAPVTQRNVAEVVQAIDQMPPEVKQQLGEELAAGRPLGEIIQQLVGQSQGDRNA